MSGNSTWSLKLAHEHLKQWWPAAGFDSAGQPYLIATADVHRDWYRLVVRAWNRDSQSRLLYFATLTTPGKIVEICDQLGVMRQRTLLDRRHVPEQVRMWCAQYGWRSFLGEDDKDYLHPDGVRRMVSPEKLTAPFQGKKDRPHWIDARTQVSEYNFSKWTALRRLMLLRTLTGPDGLPLFTGAADAPDVYYTELDDYTGIPEMIAGEEVMKYKSTNNDHAADCECMGIGGASMLGLTGAESIGGQDTNPQTS